MTIPFGRRRLVIALVADPGRALEYPAAAGASDRELARLARPVDPDFAREQWETQAMLQGVRRI
jgi:hypothetical protein